MLKDRAISSSEKLLDQLNHQSRDRWVGTVAVRGECEMGEFYHWLGASAEPAGLGSAEAPEPDKPSPSFGCHLSRCKHSFEIEGPRYLCQKCGYWEAKFA